MKTTATLITALLLSVVRLPAATTPLFDGKTFAGWEGDIGSVWRIEDGALVAGSLEKRQEKNNFLATARDYAGFELPAAPQVSLADAGQGELFGDDYSQPRFRRPRAGVLERERRAGIPLRRWRAARRARLRRMKTRWLTARGRRSVSSHRDCHD
jgi:hypothetical protein